jgi:amino acid transporter
MVSSHEPIKCSPGFKPLLINSNLYRYSLDFPAALLTGAIIALLVYGMKETARFNTAVTIVSLAVVGFVIVVGGLAVEPENWEPFAPNGGVGLYTLSSVSVAPEM